MRLVNEDYLNKYPQKGYTIRCISEAETRQLQMCRYILESGVIDMFDLLIKSGSIFDGTGGAPYTADAGV